MASINKKSTGIKGGTRPGAGRKKGSPNRRTAELQARVEASGLTPLEYMLKILRDEKADKDDRFEAAKAAAPYVHAKLASVEHSGPNGAQLFEKLVVEVVGA